MARLAATGKRVGYTLFLIAIVTFGVGAAQGFPTLLVRAVVWSLAVGSLALAPSIVVAYGVKAAEREEREEREERRG
jgi:hypothetical protein